ncbi:O-antigen ligase family protein [Sphingomonas echinoides]|uniref:O-antigen ligase family protein n=1 Tax=Sphingomonas echinoides TaxID=59803 RepID=UPI0024139F92|nr:O-antigen ligase family protein [Sphingomonas echinoides]
MLTLAKNFVYLEVVMAIGWAMYFAVLKRESRTVAAHFPFLVATAFNAAFFAIPYFPLVHLAVFLIPIVAGRTRKHLLMVMLVGLFCIPALIVSLNTAGLVIFSWTMQATLGLGGLVALASSQRDRMTEPGRWNVPLAAFLVLMIIIAIRGTSATNWVRQAIAIISAYGISVVVIGQCLRSAGNRRAFLITLAGIGSMLAAVLTYEARVHWPLYTSLYGKFQVQLPGMMVKFRGGSMRAFGPLDEATNAGFALVIAFAAALACHREFRNGPARYVVPGVVAIGLLAPQSRGGLIGAAVVLLCYAFYHYGSAGLAKAVALLTSVGALYFARSRLLGGATADAQNTADYRQQLFNRGMEEFWKNPIIGDSMDQVTARMEDMRQGEGIIDFVNSYLYFGLALGAVGVLLFCIVLYFPAARLLLERNRLNRHGPTGTFAGFAFGSLLAAGVMLAFTSIPQRPIIVTLVVAGAALGLRPPRRAVRNATTPGTMTPSTPPSERGLARSAVADVGPRSTGS